MHEYISPITSVTALVGSLASCGHPRNEDGECFFSCSHWPEIAPNAGEMIDDIFTCQRIAEAFWSVATSKNTAIASADSPMYRTLRMAFVSTVEEAFNVSILRAEQVYNLLTENGPNASLEGTNGSGVFSLVHYLMINPPDDSG